MAKFINPVGKRILVQPEDVSDKTVSGIIVGPGAVPITYFKGVALAVGSEVVMIKKDDYIAFLKYGYDEIEQDGKKYYLVEEQSVIATFNDK